MTDNVIILGAGASVDAGIPLLGNFVDKMLEYGLKGKVGNKAISNEDKKIFDEAMKVRNELDGYHGRAAFNDRNIEDILSILAFNLMAGDRIDRIKLDWMTKAIARTVDLSTNTRFDSSIQGQIQQSKTPVYTRFWNKLFKEFASGKNFPTIITFNYDLVLECSLFQALNSTAYSSDPKISRPFPYDGIAIDYHYDGLPKFFYKVKDTVYTVKKQFFNAEIEKGVDPIEDAPGTTTESCNENDLKNLANIEILKLHGSINFPAKGNNKNASEESPIIPAENAYILPPLLNKWVLGEQLDVWRVALERMRETKNIVIVGYSLPPTDIYMQYFFKAALGPNVNLNKITVFNPVLFQDGNECLEMQTRYGNCFSPQLQNRIVFKPDTKYSQGKVEPLNVGTFLHFSRVIGDRFNELFF